MEYEFVVTHDFDRYRIGNTISDPAEIARIEAAPRLLANVSRRFPVPVPAPAAAVEAPKASKASDKP